MYGVFLYILPPVYGYNVTYKTFIVIVSQHPQSNSFLKHGWKKHYA